MALLLGLVPLVGAMLLFALALPGVGTLALNLYHDYANAQGFRSSGHRLITAFHDRGRPTLDIASRQPSVELGGKRYTRYRIAFAVKLG